MEKLYHYLQIALSFYFVKFPFPTTPITTHLFRLSPAYLILPNVPIRLLVRTPPLFGAQDKSNT